MGAFGSPELGVAASAYRPAPLSRRRPRRWPYFLAGMGAMLGLEFLALATLSVLTLPRG